MIDDCRVTPIPLRTDQLDDDVWDRNRIGVLAAQASWFVEPRFLTTMQIPILAGREIDGHDQPGSTPVAVISERLARSYFGNENPLGRRITSHIGMHFSS